MQNENQQLRWGVIGCGVIAHQMAEQLALDGRHIEAVANRTYEKAQAFAREYDIPVVCKDYDELIDNPQIDAIYITTPHNTHIHFLRKALAAHKHVLCEKSITLNAAELREAINLAHDNGVVLMDATTILHMPLYKKLLARLHAGDFGRMNIAQLNFGSYKPYDMENRFFNPKLAGGAMLDIGVYAITLARLVMQSTPNEIVSLMNRCQTGVDEESGIVMRNAQNQLATITLSLHSKQPKRAVISCDKAYIEIMEYPRAQQARIVWTEDGHEEILEEGKTERALLYEIGDLEAAVEGDKEAQSLMCIAYDVMCIMDRLRQDWGVVYPEEIPQGLEKR